MAALVLLPPLPPEEVARGQVREESAPTRATPARTSSYRWQKGTKPSLWLSGLDDITFVVWSVDPNTGRRTKVDATPKVTAAPPAPAPTPKRQRPIRTYAGANGRIHGAKTGKGIAFIGLTEFERAQMDKDIAQLEEAGVYDDRPVTWGDCPPAGPCGFTSCRMNLYVTVDPVTGSIRMNFPGKEIDEIGETCALRAAENGPMTVRQVAAAFNVNYQRVHQIETAALVKIRRRKVKLGD